MLGGLGGNGFLRDFIQRRAEHTAKQAPQAPAQGKKAVMPIVGMGLPAIKSEMTLAEIIEKKPKRKEVEKYLKARCEED